MAHKLRRHKLARVSMVVLALFYFGALFAPFLAVQDLTSYDSVYVNCPPTPVRFVDAEGHFSLRPFVYGLKSSRDPDTLRKIFTPDPSRKYPVHFFVHGTSYSVFGLFQTDIHLFGASAPGRLFLFGTDSMGRDLYSRILLGSRISLTVPLAGVALSFLFGLIIGSLAGYFGGVVDYLVQRLTEIIRSFPTLPLWMALSAAIPPTIPSTQVYLWITVILSFISWTELARVVRSKFISLKKEDYVMAAKIAGVGDFKIIVSHLVPGFMSYLIVNMTLSIPNMILGETSMSFLGLGIRPPATSWGVLLQEAQEIQNVALYNWKLIPLVFVVVTVLAFNFMGDGLRDAADPYK